MPYRLEKYRIIPKPIKRIASHVGRRGIVLLFFGFLCLVTGQAWITRPPSENPNLYVVGKIMPWWVWGGLWAVIGAIMCVASMWKRLEHYAFGLSAGMAMATGLCVLSVAFPGPPPPGPRLLVAVFTYFFYAAFILLVSGWPERETIVIKVVDQEDEEDYGS